MRALEQIGFGESYLGYLSLILALPFLALTLFRHFLTERWALVLIILFVAVPVGVLFGTSFVQYQKWAARGFADPAAYVIHRRIIRSSAQAAPVRARHSFSAFAVRSCSRSPFFVRPVVAPAAAMLLAGVGLAALNCRQWPRLIGLCLGVLPVFSMALHNWVYGHVFMLLSSNSRDANLLVTPPSAYAETARELLRPDFSGRPRAHAARQLAVGPSGIPLHHPLNAAGVAVPIYIGVRGHSFDRSCGSPAWQRWRSTPWRCSIAATSPDIISSPGSSPCWRSCVLAGGRARLAQPALSQVIAAPDEPPAVAMACIRPHPAAKEYRMNKAPTGIANGLTNYGDRDFSLYLRRSFAQSMGYSRTMLEKPVVGIAYTPSGFNNCHRHFPELLEAVKRGVLAAGALPLEFPTISLGEVFLNPTSLKFRNLMSMDTEEMVRAQPMDAVVLMGGCDKTVPAQLMGAVSAGRPAVMLIGGPMMTGRYRGERLGACTDCRRFWAQYRAGTVSDQEISEIEARLATTAGSCAVMGTASTMACLTEALGLCLPGTAAIPAVHADRLRAAEVTGAAAVRLIGSQLTPDRIVNQKSVENALRVLLAIGGSTNAVIHMTAIAGRAGVPVSLKRLNELSDTTPVLVNLKPVGNGYMEDFFAAGGIGALLRELKDLLHLDAMTVTGETLGERLAGEGATWVDRSIIAERAKPLEPHGGLVALFGNLAPQGAILKRSAADTNLFEMEGRAVVFSSLEDLAARIDDPALDVTPQDILVLQNAGPHSPAAMPEAGYLPIPKKLASQGVKDMVRVSDARMSGTAFGTIVLHVTPDAASGGPLRLVRSGDRIKLSVKNRSIDLLVGEAELKQRAAAAKPMREQPQRGYAKLYAQEILGADDGCDFAFLRPR